METKTDTKEAKTQSNDQGNEPAENKANVAEASAKEVKPEVSDSIKNLFKHVTVKTERKEKPQLKEEPKTETTESPEGEKKTDDPIGEAPKKEEAKTERENNLSAELQAQLYTSLWSSSLQIGFGFAHRKKTISRLLDTKSFGKAADLTAQVIAGVKKEEDLTPKQLNDVKWIKKFQQRFNELALDDDEAQLIKQNLTGLISENNYQMPPGIGLAITGASSIISRGLQLMFD